MSFVKALLNVSQIVALKMIENKIKGSIVNISSQASKVNALSMINRSSNYRPYFL